jgi:DNA-binding CsgD family transcriptional regulator
VSPGLGPAALTGRDVELTRIRQAIELASAGEGGTVVVTGEAGIGKSRLLRECRLLAAEARMTVLAGRAVPQGGAYRPLVEAMLGHLRDTAVTESPELRPFRTALLRLVPGWATQDAADPIVEQAVDPVVLLGEGLVRLLRQLGGEAGCVLVLDDLHWADADTLAVVEFLAGAIGTSRILLVAAARTDEAWPVDRLTLNEDVTQMRLDRLGRDEVVALALSCLPDGRLPNEVDDLLVAKSEGLPLAVEELLSGLVESGALVTDEDGWRLRAEPRIVVPDSLSALVSRRLATLDGDQRAVVDAAAVLGREVDWSLLPRVAALAEDAVLGGLRAATDAHLLVPAESPGRLSWRHGLIRDAVLGLLGPAEHSVLARRAAAALVPDDSTDSAAAAVELLIRAGDGRPAADLLTDLARRAMAVGALGTADEQLERAFQLAPDHPRLAAERVRVRALSGRVGEALAAGEAALGLMTGDRHATLCLQLARTAAFAGRWDQANTYLDRAGRPDDVRTLAIAADIAFGSGRQAEAAEFATRAVRLAERDGMPEQQCEALEVLGRCARQTDGRAADEAFRRAAQVAAEHGLVPARISALLALGTIELLQADASATLLQARALALDAGMLGRVCDIDQILTDCALVVEGPVAAAATGSRTAELAASLRLHRVQAMVELMVAGAAGMRGDIAAMTAALDAAQARPDAPFEATAARPCIEAMVPLLAHDLPRARDFLDRGIALLAAHGPSAPIGYWGLWALVRTVLADRDSAARDALRQAPALMRTINQAALGFAEAVAAGRAGRPDEAATMLAAADGLIPTQHWWRRMLRLLVAEAAIADGWGDPVAMLRADLTAFEATGEELLARTSRTLLRRAGVTVRRGRGATFVPPSLRALGVTSREMDVLGLVADRLTNQQVAERLFLSPRTIETHVASLLAKTGTTSRAELVSYAARAS